MADQEKWMEIGRTLFPGFCTFLPSVTRPPTTPNFFLQVGRAVLLENDETRQANGVGAEE